jgi:large subunit ribosomal protein L2
MALVKVKPTSPGRRGLVKVVNANLHKGRPVESLIEAKKRGSGRNNNGHITMRHQGGGHKQHYRIVDFRRTKTASRRRWNGCYDPNRSANLAVAHRRRALHRGAARRSAGAIDGGADAPIKPGNCLPLRNIPVGTTIHCVEMLPGKGAQIARSAGASVQLLAREGIYAQVHALG